MSLLLLQVLCYGVKWGEGQTAGIVPVNGTRTLHRISARSQSCPAHPHPAPTPRVPPFAGMPALHTAVQTSNAWDPLCEPPLHAGDPIPHAPMCRLQGTNTLLGTDADPIYQPINSGILF